MAKNRWSTASLAAKNSDLPRRTENIFSTKIIFTNTLKNAWRQACVECIFFDHNPPPLLPHAQGQEGKHAFKDLIGNVFAQCVGYIHNLYEIWANLYENRMLTQFQ